MESVTPVVFRVGVDQPSLACFPPLVVSKRRPHPTTKQAGEGRAPISSRRELSQLLELPGQGQ